MFINLQIGVALCLTFVSIAADVCLLAQCANNITAFLTQFLRLDVDWYEGNNLILRGEGASDYVFFLFSCPCLIPKGYFFTGFPKPFFY